MEPQRISPQPTPLPSDATAFVIVLALFAASLFGLGVIIGWMVFA